MTSNPSHIVLELYFCFFVLFLLFHSLFIIMGTHESYFFVKICISLSHVVRRCFRFAQTVCPQKCMTYFAFVVLIQSSPSTNPLHQHNVTCFFAHMCNEHRITRISIASLRTRTLNITYLSNSLLDSNSSSSLSRSFASTL